MVTEEEEHFSRYFICIITVKTIRFCVNREILFFFVFRRGLFCIWCALFNANFKKSIMTLKVLLLFYEENYFCDVIGIVEGKRCHQKSCKMQMKIRYACKIIWLKTWKMEINSHQGNFQLWYFSSSFLKMQ